MRKLIASTFVSLDGVMQAPGGPDEDPTGGFAFGGWTFPYWDEVMGRSVRALCTPHSATRRRCGGLTGAPGSVSSVGGPEVLQVRQLLAEAVEPTSDVGTRESDLPLWPAK